MSTLQEQREAHFAELATRAALACSPTTIAAPTLEHTTYTALERAQRTLRFGIPAAARGGGQPSILDLERLR